MRVLVMVKATKNSEAGMLPGDPGAPAGFDKLFEQMGTAPWLSLEWDRCVSLPYHRLGSATQWH